MSIASERVISGVNWGDWKHKPGGPQYSLDAKQQNKLIGVNVDDVFSPSPFFLDSNPNRFL